MSKIVYFDEELFFNFMSKEEKQKKYQLDKIRAVTNDGYRRERDLGAGNFGFVYLASKLNPNTKKRNYYAIKELK